MAAGEIPTLAGALWIALLAAVGLVWALAGCASPQRRRGGAAETGTVRREEPLAQLRTTAIRADGDADNPRDIDGNGDVDPRGPDGDDDRHTAESARFPDGDDRASLTYGVGVSAVDEREIAAVVSRYYAAASTADGAAACALLLPSIARAVPATYGTGGGPAYLRGHRTCGGVLSALFGHLRSRLAPPVEIVEVRRKGEEAQVVLGSRRMPASSIALQRFGGAWRLGSLVARPLP